MFNFGGGMLTGSEIEKQIKKGNICIDPYDPKCLNPNSYNLKLHPQLLIYSRNYSSGRKALLPEEKKTDIEKPKESTEIDSINDINITDAIDNATGSMYIDLCNAFIDHNALLTKDNPILQFHELDPLDMNAKNETIEFTIPDEGYVLQPGVVYIGRTCERTWTDKFIPMINGRSSGGRLGLSIHICAGFGDIGFDGTWTLELTVVEPVRIYPYTEVAQVCYFKPYGKDAKLYRGRYFGQIDATASRFYKSKE